jgi:hypothetical protein
MPDDPNVMDSDQEMVYNLFLTNLDKSFSSNRVSALTCMSQRKCIKALDELETKNKIISLDINARETSYCIQHSIGHIELEKRLGMVRGDTPQPCMPNVL